MVRLSCWLCACRCMAAEAKAREAAARAEEREREREAKRAAAEEAKRYPMEDLTLLAELQAKAAATGKLAAVKHTCKQGQLTRQLSIICSTLTEAGLLHTF